jgi:hypothetical protein
MAAPTLVATYLVPTTGTTGSNTPLTATFTANAGEVIIVKVTHLGGAFGPSDTGGLTWRHLASFGAEGRASAGIWGTTVTATGSKTVTMTFQSAGAHAMVVERWSGASLAATVRQNATKTGTGAPMATVVTSAADSVITWVATDWNESSTTTTTYRSGAVEQRRFTAAGAYSAWFARQAAPTAATRSIGITSPSNTAWLMVGVEILGVAGGTPATEKITATVEPNATPPRIRLDVATAKPAVTVYRVAQDGTRTPVRTYNGGPFPVSGGSLVAYDPEAPYGQPVTYVADEAGITGSLEVTLDITDQVWLVHPGVPSRSQPIRIQDVSQRMTAANQSVRYPLGRRDPIVASDGRRKSDVYTLTVRTKGVADTEAMKALLADMSPLLLNIPASKQWPGMGTEYIAVGDVMQVNPGGWGGWSERYWELSCTVVARPAGGSQADNTYAKSLASYSTYAARLAAHATYGLAFDPR